MSEQIPEKYLEFCKAVGRLCREAGLHDFTGSFSPPLFAGDWRNKIEFHWEQGRHGAKNQENLTSDHVKDLFIPRARNSPQSKQRQPNNRTQTVVRWGGGTWEDDNRLCRDPKFWQPLPAPPTQPKTATACAEHDWRWLGWPLSSPNSDAQWCSNCGLRQVPSNGQWVDAPAQPVSAEQPPHEYLPDGDGTPTCNFSWRYGQRCSRFRNDSIHVPVSAKDEIDRLCRRRMNVTEEIDRLLASAVGEAETDQG